MDKRELRELYEEQDAFGKAMLLEKLAFCKYADPCDFENYFRIGALKDSELLYLVSFLVHHNCFQMLAGIMNRYKEKFIFPDTSLLREFEPDDTLVERISRIESLTDM